MTKKSKLKDKPIFVKWGVASDWGYLWNKLSDTKEEAIARAVEMSTDKLHAGWKPFAARVEVYPIEGNEND